MPTSLQRLPPVAALLARVRRGRRPEIAPIRLGQRRIYVLPTTAGFAFAAALLVMLLAAINYNLSLGYGLVFLLAGTALASLVHAFRNLLQLSIRPGRAEPVFCGEAARFSLHLDNPRAERRPALELRAHGNSTRFDLPAADETEIHLAVPTHRRGRLALGRCTLQTTWPLGLARAWSVIVPALDCVVFPAPETDPPPLPGNDTAGHGGGRTAGPGDDDFAGLRPYRDADSPRHVAWKTLARGGPLQTKQFAGELGGDIVLDWTRLPAALDDEARLSRLTAWLLEAERRGLAAGLALPGSEIAPARGRAHLMRCLSALAEFPSSRTEPADA